MHLGRLRIQEARAAVALEARSDGEGVPGKKTLVGKKGKEAVFVKQLKKS